MHHFHLIFIVIAYSLIMVYGVAIDNNFLKLMSEYRDKNDSDITASDRGMVAMQQINVYKEKATKGLDEMHAEFGAGIT